MGAHTKMASQWHFEQDDQQQWHWQRIERAEKSEKSFSSAAECMLDAVRRVVDARRAQFDLSGKNLLQ